MPHAGSHTPRVAWEPAETIVLLDRLDELVGKASSVPLTDQVRLNRGKVDLLLDELRTAVNDGPAELVGPLDELDALVRGAKSVTLTDEIRAARDDVYDRLDRLRAACATRPRRDHLPPDVAAVLDEFDGLVGNARTVPLTAQVRLDRATAYALFDRLRATVRGPSAEVADALDELDGLLHGAKSIPFTNEIRVELVEVLETLDRIGAG